MALQSIGTARVIEFPCTATSGVARLAGQMRDVIGDERARAFASSVRRAGRNAEAACHVMADHIDALLTEGPIDAALQALRMAEALVNPAGCAAASGGESRPM